MRNPSFLPLLFFIFNLLHVQGHPTDLLGNCSHPTNLSAIASTTSADLTWAAVPDAAGYWVEVESEQNTPFYHIEVQVITNSFTPTGLVENGKYKFKVRTNCGTDKSDWSAWYFWGTGTSGGGSGGSCDAPGVLAASGIAGGAAILSWSTVPGATGYWVEIESENLLPVFHLELPVNSTTYTVVGLTSGVTYKFKVRANCGGNSSNWSGWVYFTGSGSSSGGSGGPCDMPSGLSVMLNSGGSATLTWNAVPAAAGYWVEIESENIIPALHLEAPTSTNLYVVSNLSANGKYKFKVRTVCNGEQSNWSPWVTFNGTTGQTSSGPTAGFCSKPQGLSVTSVLPTSAMLFWNKAPGAHGYSVRVEKESGADQQFSLGTSDTFINVANLVPGNLYKYKVRTKCNGGGSKWSEWLFFSTPLMLGPGNGGLEERNESSALLHPMNIFPNPVSGLLNIQLENAPANAEHTLIIADLAGRIIAQQQFSTENTLYHFDCSSYPNGIYRLYWTNGTHSATQKVVVQH